MQLNTGELRCWREPEVLERRARKLLINLVALQTDGPRSLSTSGIPELRKITLIEREILRESTFHEVNVARADDLFRCADEDPVHHQPVPGTITRAIFALLFADGHCIQLELRPPDFISSAPLADLPVVERWLLQSHLATAQQPSDAQFTNNNIFTTNE